VLAASRLTAGATVMLSLALALAEPVALLFGAASAAQPGLGSLPRILFAHVATTICASSAVFFSLVTIRAATAAAGGERLADRLASLLQFLAILVFVETFVFLPGILFDLLRAVRTGADVPLWYALPMWFGALYGWLAEGGARTRDIDAALLATVVPTALGVTVSLLPARAIARRVQETLASHCASMLTSIIRRLVVAGCGSTSVRGMAIFAAATITRSRRHAVILASYAGLAFAMAAIELLTSGFTDHFSIAAPRRDNLAVPLVCLFFAIFGLRAALTRSADPAANWPFRIASPAVRDSRQAAWLIVVLCGITPILVGTLLTATAIWPLAVALRVLALDVAAAFLLAELALARWTGVPCASVRTVATEAVKSTWPLQVLGLYLFAFRGADLEMLALAHADGVTYAVASTAVLILVLRTRHVITSAHLESTLEESADDTPLLLRLSAGDA